METAEFRRRLLRSGSHRLRLAFEKLTGYDPGPLRIIRTYAGRNQRAAGAWSWFARSVGGLEVCGSQWPLREVLKASAEGRLVADGFDLIVERRGHAKGGSDAD